MKPSGGAEVLRDAIVVALVALLTFQALRRFVGDYYRVPTHSMEPLLHGDPATGDVVFVETFSSSRDLARRDLVVVRNPNTSGQLVKRIAATGDDDSACWINLMGGDVWLGANKQDLRREVKDPAQGRDLRIDWARWPAIGDSLDGLEFGSARAADGRLVLPSKPLMSRAEMAARPINDQGDDMIPGAIRTSRLVDATYLMPDGVRGREGEDFGVWDCGFDLQLLEPPERLVGVLRSSMDLAMFVWTPATGAFELWHDSGDVEARQLAPETGPCRVEFGRLDDQLFFATTGNATSLWRMPRPATWNAMRGGPRGPRTRLCVAAFGERPAVFTSVVVWRDVFYFRDRIIGVAGNGAWPCEVPAGTWFLLGDNSFDSHDSRSFGAVPTDAYLGRPWFILGPGPRRRWLR